MRISDALYRDTSSGSYPPLPSAPAGGVIWTGTISCLARTSPASSSRRAFCQRMKANTRSLFQCTMPVCSSRCGRTPAADQGSAAFLVPDIDCSFLPPVRLLRLLILCLIFSQIGLFLQLGDYGAVTFNQVF